MTLPAILKSRKALIILIAIVVLSGVGVMAYKAELRKQALQATPPPTAEEIKRMSDEAWESYKREQAALEGEGIVTQTDNIPDQSAKIRDYFLEALRETLPVGADKSVVVELLEMDDPCLKMDEQATNATLLVYECTVSARYPQGTIRRATFDNNGKLLDYYIDSNPGLHSGIPYVTPTPEPALQPTSE